MNILAQMIYVHISYSPYCEGLNIKCELLEDLSL
jgi:hypothetical protein